MRYGSGERERAGVFHRIFLPELLAGLSLQSEMGYVIVNPSLLPSSQTILNGEMRYCLQLCCEQ
nr:hypothetical protein [uncultured Mediterraneibacter sp.]